MKKPIRPKMPTKPQKLCRKEYRIFENKIIEAEGNTAIGKEGKLRSLEKEYGRHQVLNLDLDIKRLSKQIEDKFGSLDGVKIKCKKVYYYSEGYLYLIREYEIEDKVLEEEMKKYEEKKKKYKEDLKAYKVEYKKYKEFRDKENKALRKKELIKELRALEGE